MLWLTRRLPFILFSASLVAAANAPVVLDGAGSTFVYPILAQWVKAYQRLHPGIEIAYDAVGSGRGISRMLARTVDFGATDGPMTDAELRHARTPIVHIPVILGAVVPAYNLPGVNGELKFTPAALAGIYLGTVKRWDDPELVRANPGLRLPDRAISVLFRTDGSGTTYVWTDYLSKVSEAWKGKVGRNTSVNWPVGLGGKGNEGVAGLVKQTPNSVGYVELIYALQNKLPYGLVQNASGEFVKADLPSVTAAAGAFAKAMPADFRVSITNPPGKGAYPIASFTWLLVPASPGDPRKGRVIVDFLKWMLADGQKMTDALSYAPLPKDVVGLVQDSLGQIRVPAAR